MRRYIKYTLNYHRLAMVNVIFTASTLGQFGIIEDGLLLTFLLYSAWYLVESREQGRWGDWD